MLRFRPRRGTVSDKDDDDDDNDEVSVLLL